LRPHLAVSFLTDINFQVTAQVDFEFAILFAVFYQLQRDLSSNLEIIHTIFFFEIFSIKYDLDFLE
jgi:hypothetical protein